MTKGGNIQGQKHITLKKVAAVCQRPSITKVWFFRRLEYNWVPGVVTLAFESLFLFQHPLHA